MLDKRCRMAIYFPCNCAKWHAIQAMNTISIRKNSHEGQLLCDVAEFLGIDPASLLAGICINATRKRKTTTQPSQSAQAPSQQPELPLELPPAPEPPQPAAAPSAGMFDIA